MFAALGTKETAVRAVARAVKSAIVHGELEPGARLGEQALAKRFQVSRGTVRGALAQLANARLLTVLHGSGYRVEDYRRTAGPDLLSALVEAAADRAELPRIVEDLFLVRRLLARVVLERIAARPQRPVRRILAAMAEFTAVVDRKASNEEIAASDMEVLAALLEASGSTVLQLCFNLIQSVVQSLEPLRGAMYAEPDTNVAGYQLLEIWLERRDRASVDGLMRVLEERDAISLAVVRQRVKGKP